MAARDVLIRIKADASGLIAGVDKSVHRLKAMDAELQKNASRRQAINDVGSAFGKVGLAATVGLGVAAKAAMDWETAWAGVTKTVEGSSAQLAGLEEDLRQMAKTMPSTHTEIAAVAQAAGALGVATPDVANFTKTMVMLGEATDDLTPDQAATSLAQLMNVMQTAPDDVDNLANALVRLGNNGASTEGQILQMAQNLAGAGATVGLTESQVLGIANALSSVGIEAEAGGSAVSKILIDMAKAAATGSPKLKVWAETAGVTATEFKNMMDNDPAQAFQSFTTGLGKINAEGGDVFTLLSSLGQSDVRVTRALLGMANAGDMLGESLADSADAYASGTDASDEYAKRSETAASQIKVAWNGIKDNMIDVGASVLPIVKDFSAVVADLTGWFSDLSPEVQGAVTKFLGLTAAIGAGGFVLSRAVTGYANLQTSLLDLGIAQDKLTRGQLFRRGGAALGGLALTSMAGEAGKANEALGILANAGGGALMGFAVGGPIGGAIGGAAGALVGLAGAARDSKDGMQEARDIAGEYAATLDAVSGKATEATRALAFEDLRKSGALGNASAVGISSRDLVDAALGDAKKIQAVQRQIAEALSSGNPLAVGVGGDLLTQLGEINAAFKGSQADAQEAAAAIQDYGVLLEGLPPEVQVDLKNRGYQVTADQVDALRRKYDLTPGQVDTIVRALGVKSAAGGMNTIQDIMGALDGRTATVYIRAVKTGASLGGLAGQVNQLDGSVLDFYANGGVRENRVAQFAPAGAWRVWAEPETGGEAYIPLAQSKRKRSMEIWAETGKRLGAQGFANGGVVGGGSGGSVQSMRLTSGALEIRGGKAYVAGIAEVVVSSESAYRQTSRGARRQ